MRTYICGGMRGYEQYNFPAFDRVANELAANGHFPVNPAAHDRAQGFDENKPLDEQTNGFVVEDAFRWDIEQILTCDAMVCLDGWEASRGAVAEHAVARMLGLHIFYQTPRDDDRYHYSWNAAVPIGVIPHG